MGGLRSKSYNMLLLEELLQSYVTVALMLVLMCIFVSFFSRSKDQRREPPGPQPLPLLGNLLQVDLKRLDRSLVDLSKKYGSVFTVHLGPQKVVILAGYKTVKQALVNHAVEFGERRIPQFGNDLSNSLSNGIIFANGDSWKEMRRFALSNLRDFGMGRKAAEDKIIEEIQYLIEVFERHEGQPFSTAQSMNYAVSNIICSILYGSRFEYSDKEFKLMVDRANDNFRLAGSLLVQLFDMYPWIFQWVNRMRFNRSVADNRNQIKQLIGRLQETLNVKMCRGFVDSFLAHKQKLESYVTVALMLVLMCILVSFFLRSKDQRREPPGPQPLPVLGNLLQVDLERLDRSLVDLSKKYGSVFTVYLGPQKVVVLAGYKTVKQALVNYAVEFGERQIPQFGNDRSNSLRNGILFSNGESWKEMRRFALSNLRDFGMGRKAAENKIIEDIQYLFEVFERHEGRPFNTGQSINPAVSNIICSIVYGSRFEYSDEEFKLMVDRINDNFKLAGSSSIKLFDMYPWIFQWARNRMLFKRNVAENRRHIKQLIGRLQETLNVQMCKGFVDSFLAHKQKLEDSGIKDSYYNIENLVTTASNLFAGGSDSTSITLRWGLLLMAKYPQIQDQVQEELSRVVGSRQVRVEDRRNLPYTDAVIHETQRLANVVPLSLPHKTSQDVTFQGFFIKEGTTVFPLLTSVHHDESEWESPNSFNPSHFLDTEGKFIRRDSFMPFSAGSRACPGESLARMELFLFFTSLLQRFRFTPPPGVKEDDLDLTPVVGFNLTPSPHELCAVSREGIQNEKII
uniref:cytochrome P450 2K1-like n=1 Tax=Gasterosteus aculeatus aculeatus TaxID=481459 RepID=UPI001A9966C8|nr:cytochrome P450 2K1-like [Gasterosteus aculeatus aculeatus]